MSEETGSKPGEFGTVVGGLSLTSERKGKMGRYDPDHYTVSEEMAEVLIPESASRSVPSYWSTCTWV